MSTRERILKSVEEYLEISGLSKTKFGLLVANDPRLVDRLRAGKDITTATADNIEAFITTPSQAA